VKTSRKYVFLGRETRITARLVVTVPYITFWGFKKISNFASKSKSAGLWFYLQHMFVVKTRDGNGSELSM
jgi:hypothetical protein